MAWVDPWGALGRDFPVFVGLDPLQKKYLKFESVNAIKAWLDISLHQAVKFDFTADLTGRLPETDQE